MTQLNSILPFFIVRDLAAARAFYIRQLGFECSFSSPDNDPYFAIVSRDNVSIMLKEIGPEIGAQPNPSVHEWARWDAFVNVSDPEKLFRDLDSKGVEFVSPFSIDRNDGIQGFELKDADGYVLFFGKPLLG